MTAKNIRDMLAGPAHPSESVTLQTLAAERIEEGGGPEPDLMASFFARMPGDPATHPKGLTMPENPRPDLGIMALSRALHAGLLTDPIEEKQARAYIKLFEDMSGDKLYEGRNHEPACQVEQEYTDVENDELRRLEDGGSPNRLKGRADPWPYK
jgi:hypothetical protein